MAFVCIIVRGGNDGKGFDKSEVLSAAVIITIFSIAHMHYEVLALEKFERKAAAK